MPTTNIQTNTIGESQTPRLINGSTKGIKAQEKRDVKAAKCKFAPIFALKLAKKEDAHRDIYSHDSAT